jgi:hypothetical protein
VTGGLRPGRVTWQNSSMSFLRAAACLSFASSMILVAVPGAWGQGAGAPPLPLGIDLKKVPVGSWSDYSLITGARRPHRQRISLVGKSAKGYELEVAVEGGPVPFPIITRVELGLQANAGKRVKRAVMRAGVRQAMEIPGSSELVAEQFSAIDEKAYLSTQEIEVPAGRFKAKLYRTVSPRGVTVDYWVSEEVHPLGIAKMEIDFRRAGTPRAIFRLVARGAGARGTVLKPVRPFDAKKLAAEMMADMKQAADPTGPARLPHPGPAAPPRSPH